MNKDSTITHLTKEDAPVLVYHGTEQDRPGDIHHGNFGRVLKERMDALGLECVRRMSDDYENAQGQNAALFAFVTRHFRMGADAVVSRDAQDSLLLELRSRTKTGAATEQNLLVRTATWNPRSTAIIVCDMWDDHTCKGAARRVAEMAPALDRTIKAARKRNVLIVHAPSGTMAAYEGTPQRRRAMEAPLSKGKVDIKWNEWNAELEGEPLAFIRGRGCGCAKPCPGWVEEDGRREWKGGKPPWTRQIDTIAIAPEDATSDSGQEIYNLLEQRGIGNVILMGVHTNICVSGRPFGLRQMVYHGKNVVLCRDLTDAFFQSASPDVDQFQGTRLVVAHIEKRLCPTITSASITGEPEFRFEGDTARAEP
jgi:nicotinamidase-related amidase